MRSSHASWRTPVPAVGLLLSLAAAGCGKRDGGGNAVGPKASIPVFGRQVCLGNVELSANVDVPLESLAKLAEQSLRDLRAGLAQGEQLGTPSRYRIYFGRDTDTILALEEQFGLPRSDPSPMRTFAFRGGYYPQADMIALVHQPGWDRWHLVHELTHVVFNEVTGASCDFINEGLAEYSAARILGSVPSARDTRDDLVNLLVERCRTAVQQGVPTLEHFFGLDYWQFRDERNDGRNFALAWSLVQCLLEDDDEEVRGRFPDLLEALRGGRDPWRAFCRTYSVPGVERVWHDSLRRMTSWTLAFGAWRLGPRSVRCDASPSGSGLLLHDGHLAASQPFSISYRLGEPVDGEPALGFVLGFRDTRNFTALSWHLTGGVVAVARLEDGRWSESEFHTVRVPAESARKHALHLASDPQGTVTMRLGDQVLMRQELPGVAHGGSFGVWVEQRSGSSDDLRTSFVLADLRVDTP